MKSYPIPVVANWLIAGAAIIASCACLWFASHAHAWWWMLAAAVVFSYTNNTLFSLHHEAVHGVFNPNRRINHAAGYCLQAFFPPSFPYSASAISATTAVTAPMKSCTTTTCPISHGGSKPTGFTAC